MRVLELFAGSATLTRVARDRGHEAFAVDLVSEAADLRADVRALQVTDLPEAFRRPDVLWLSPPCTTFSRAAGGYYWPDGEPSVAALEGIEILAAGLRLLMQLRPRVWFLENPVGRMGTLPVMADLEPRTVAFCPYGFEHQKPTHVWTNCHTWLPRPMCGKGAPCHRAAPTGTAGLAGVPKARRAVLPVALCSEVIEAAERQVAGLEPVASLEAYGPLFAGVGG